MAQIQPNSTIYVLTGIPLDQQGKNTILFSNPAQQESWMVGHKIATFERYSYQRKNLGQISVQADYVSVMRANYVMFRNDSYENKWFYAFVTSVDYINDKVCYINFKLDPMQTWLFDHELHDSFVEREHSATDEPGDNIIPEPFELGEAVYANYSKILDLSDCCVLIGVIRKDDDRRYYTGREYDGVFNGCTLRAYAPTSTSQINIYLSDYQVTPGDIVTMYMVPKRSLPALTDYQLYNGYDLPSGTNGRRFQIALPERPETVDTYQPKNKKLLTYPFTFCHIDNGQGNAIALRYEFFQSGTAAAEITTTITQPVRVSLNPSFYKGAANDFMAERLDIGAFPLCAWRNNGYEQWIAQQGIPQAINITSGVVSGAVSFLAGGPVLGAAQSAISLVNSAISMSYKSSLTQDTVSGTMSNGGNLIGQQRQGIYAAVASINRQQAKVIDDYFTMFGYAVNQVKTPSRTNRPKWNYVKTAGVNLNSRCPVDDENAIRAMYDNGITFWNPSAAVGDYSQDNSV